MINSKIIGTGSYVPENIVSNIDLEKLVDTNDEWIVSRTGIRERRISAGEGTADLATKAALDAIKLSGLSVNQIDYIIVATITSDTYTPSTASIVQSNIGAVNASALDINAACTGFIYALEIGDSLIKSGIAKNILVIGSETISRIIDWKDRSTCVLFGDGAGAVVLSLSTKDEGIISTLTGSDGTRGNYLIARNIKLDNPFTDLYSDSDSNYINMNGAEVFKFATKIMEESINNIIAKANINLKDIDYIIPHQANYRILDYVGKKLKIDSSKFIINLDRYGNTSSASIPLALNKAVECGKIKKGNNIILVGFGGGLTWGATLIKY